MMCLSQLLFSAALGVVGCLASEVDGAVLKGKLQALVNQLSDELQPYLNSSVAIQFGWKSESDNFAVAAGKTIKGAVTPEDTFLFGSGTKTVTAASIMRLVDAKKIDLHDKVSKHIDPFLLRTNGTTLEALFGTAIADATVLHILRMEAGIPDFETSANYSGPDPCDDQMIRHGDQVWDPYYLIRFTAANKSTSGPGGHLFCQPGNCSVYSSTSYEVAGLLMTALLNPEGVWTDLDMRGAAIPKPEVDYPSLRFLNGKPGERLSSVLTVPGVVGPDASYSRATIFDQNPSILGWTCGNMVGVTKDVAAWFYDLLNPDSENTVVSDTARAEMTRLEFLTDGWNAGKIKYGAGIMENGGAYFDYPVHAPKPEDWDYVLGHGGDTFGFFSVEGYLPNAKAAFSLAMNNDAGIAFASSVMCQLLQGVAGNRSHRSCPPLWPGTASVPIFV